MKSILIGSNLIEPESTDWDIHLATAALGRLWASLKEKKSFESPAALQPGHLYPIPGGCPAARACWGDLVDCGRSLIGDGIISGANPHRGIKEKVRLPGLGFGHSVSTSEVLTSWWWSMKLSGAYPALCVMLSSIAVVHAISVADGLLTGLAELSLFWNAIFIAGLHRTWPVALRRCCLGCSSVRGKHWPW